MQGDTYGEGAILSCAEDFGAEVVISLLDAWVFRTASFAEQIKWIAWTPIDQDPPQRNLIGKLDKAALTLSFSEWGAEVLRKHAPQLKVGAMPYGVDLDVFKPLTRVDRKKMREAMGLDDDSFIVGMIGTNLLHDRKALRQNIAGFVDFARFHDEARLLLWTTDAGDFRISDYIASFGEASLSKVAVVDQWQVIFNNDARSVSRFLGVCDALLHASAAEGFGISIIEAQACGVPVIGARNSSMPELIGNRVGWLVEEQIPEWSWLSGYWLRPTPRGVYCALNEAYEELEDETIKRVARDDCVGAAKAFDWKIIGERWNEVLQTI